jgi:hypothetical protein
MSWHREVYLSLSTIHSTQSNDPRRASESSAIVLGGSHVEVCSGLE